jgi:hypothetical protein
LTRAGLLCSAGSIKIGKVLNQIKPKNKKEYGGAHFNRSVPVLCGKPLPALWPALKQAVNIIPDPSAGHA